MKDEIVNNREIEYTVNPIFPERWSPRAMSGEELSKEELMSLFEAARWAPSAYNNQPWRFLYAKKGTPNWDLFFNLLVEQNQAWVKNASVIVVVISRKIFEYNGKLSITHSFDAGSAWQSLALQGSINGLVVHGMSGFDYEKARKDLNVPEDYNVEAMIAVGKPGNKEDLPEEIQKMEVQSDRKKVSEIVFEGKFKGA
ncbi:MAG: nitroreductase family protein [Nanoarchaeota archaeon]|nr:nitroreductase family protein [Nanoarchaeota archaeon]